MAIKTETAPPLEATRFTFAEFQATAEPIADLRAVFPDDYPADAHPDPIAGRRYLGSDDICLESKPGDPKLWLDPYLPEVEETSAEDRYVDLLACEREWYGWYVAERADPEVAAYLWDIGPDSRYLRDEPDELSTLQSLYRAFNVFHGLRLGAAGEHLSDPSLSHDQQQWLGKFHRRWLMQVDSHTPRMDRPFVELY